MTWLFFSTFWAFLNLKYMHLLWRVIVVTLAKTNPFCPKLPQEKFHEACLYSDQSPFTPFININVMILTHINQYQIIGHVLTPAWWQVVNKETKAFSGDAVVSSGYPLLLLMSLNESPPEHSSVNGWNNSQPFCMLGCGMGGSRARFVHVIWQLKLCYK